jgi:hypothetical protein
MFFNLAGAAWKESLCAATVGGFGALFGVFRPAVRPQYNISGGFEVALGTLVAYLPSTNT